MGLPAILALLIVFGVLRLLAPLPGFHSALQGFSAFLDFVSLHWVAPMPTYLLDYTRSAAIRQRFERELDDFLQDDQCQRIVVIAHSLGTVIAYEGLTTVLSLRVNAELPLKPITYICLAQALGRMWRLPRTDPHRLPGVLPDKSVRWIHFWARFDPVAGPLDPHTLPYAHDWADAGEPDPDAKLRASLSRCENRAVVNTDNVLLDHNRYWENLEQVVGPIAYELVAENPGLQAMAERRLATPVDVLLRRGYVSVSASVTIVLAALLGLNVGFLAYSADWGALVRGASGTVSVIAGSIVGATFSWIPTVLQNPTIATWLSQLGTWMHHLLAPVAIPLTAVIDAVINGLITFLGAGITGFLIGAFYRWLAPRLCLGPAYGRVRFVGPRGQPRPTLVSESIEE